MNEVTATAIYKHLFKKWKQQKFKKIWKDCKLYTFYDWLRRKSWCICKLQWFFCSTEETENKGRPKYQIRMEWWADCNGPEINTRWAEMPYFHHVFTLFISVWGLTGALLITSCCAPASSAMPGWKINTTICLSWWTNQFAGKKKQKKTLHLDGHPAIEIKISFPRETRQTNISQ